MDQSTFNHGKSGDTNPKGRSRSPLLELYTRSLRNEREEKIGHRTSAACGGRLRLCYTLDEGKESERETTNCPPKRVRSSLWLATFLPHFPNTPFTLTHVSTARRRVRYYWDSDSYQRSHHWQVSPLVSYYLPVVPSSTTWYATSPLYSPPLDLTRFGGQFVVSLSDSLPSSNV